MTNNFGLYLLLMLCINGLGTAIPIPEETPKPYDRIPEETPKPAGQKSNTKCKPNEILTKSKGCVDREEYLEQHLISVVNNEIWDAIKMSAEFELKYECQEGEILTAFGCEPKKRQLRTNEAERPVLLPSHLYGNKVYKSSDGIPNLDKDKEAGDKILDSSIANYQKNSLFPPPPINMGQMSRSTNYNELKGDRILGHNRPRSYVFLPGRRLQTHRKCRPYEVLARNKRCIRKRGKTGIYKHQDHVYDIQPRHRHEAFGSEDGASEDK